MTSELGSKARNLFLLQEAGFPVPPFFCVDKSFREEEVLDRLAAGFLDTMSFSVRSCASLEDSDSRSFAGQFCTFLRVPRGEVCARVREVLDSGERPEHVAYCQAHGIDSAALQMHVIIQEMVEPDISGILFTANPQGILNESVIVCGKGSGDQVVEDRADATTYYYNLSDKSCYYEQTGASPLLTEEEIENLITSSQKIKELLNLKSREESCRSFDKDMVRDLGRGLGKDSGRSLDEDIVRDSGRGLGKGSVRSLDKDMGRSPDQDMDKDFDIEFAIQNHNVYFLQARPITSIDRTAPAIILDNSNIVESYPGITLPLTQSFIRDAYHQVFKSLLLHLTGEPETVARIDDNLKHMVDMANGRVYYRISNWYDVLLFLPFSSRLIPIWQEMMGVRDKKVSSAHLAADSGRQDKVRRSTRLKVAWSFVRFLLTCPKEMDKLDLYFQEIIRRFEALETDTEDNRILLKHYHELKDMTVERWDITLVNDMYGFLFTGLLKSRLKAKHVPDYELAANRAISGIQKLESMRPIEQLQKLAFQARDEDRLSELQSIQSNEAYFAYITRSKDSFSQALQDYIRDFGDRNVEELKLESRTFRTDPVLFIRCILQYAETLSDADNIASGRVCSTEKTSSFSGSKPSDSAATDILGGSAAAMSSTEAGTKTTTLTEAKASPVKEASQAPLRGLSAFYAKRAAIGIRNREKSRLHRGRLYGMMRSLVLQMGENLYRQKRIPDPADVFWLYCEELEAAEADAALDLNGIIAGRKREYDGYGELPPYSRLVFSGKVIDKHPRGNRRIRHDATEGVYTGTACSPGIAEGEVLLIENPSPLLDTKGKILVTKMTDPGWVFLIAPAKAIVSEKGSLLSHTAIISRELKKPAVVGIEHITECLRTGDRVRVDGDAGIITVLSV